MLGISSKKVMAILIQRYHQHNQINKAADSLKSVKIQFSFRNSAIQKKSSQQPLKFFSFSIIKNASG